MGGYGKAVIINHSQGYRTLYGHLSVIYVRPGQRVNPGRLVGKVGSTGWSTGPHLHFTIWHNGRLINPMQVLW
jgi:murein DD-endopeptidase MepM/ murein hydrolase activator NlpD